MKARVLAALVAVVALACPRAAFAKVWIESYVLTISPTSEERAHYVMALDYGVLDEVKTSGFKFVGKAPPSGVVARAPGGGRLNARSSLEAVSGEYRLDFDLPPADAKTGLESVVIEFDQALDAAYTWGGKSVRVPWVEQFKVPIGHSVVRMLGTIASPDDEFTCSGKGAARVCTRTTDAPRALSFDLAKSGSSALVVDVLLALGGLAIAALLVRSRWRKMRDELLATRGVLPPDEEPAYPSEVPQAGYRAPPRVAPKKDEEPAKPVFGPGDRERAVGAAIGCAAVLLLTIGIAACAPRSPVPLGFFVGVVAIVTGLFLMGYLAMEKGAFFLLMVPLVAIAGYVLLGPIAAAVGPGMVLLAMIIARAPPSTSSGSWSSGSSYSSCGGGGGGGGCGGGGGGGGCGG